MNFICALALINAGWADPGTQDHVIHPLGGTVRIDWTVLELHLSATSSLRTIETSEQLALRSIEGLLEDAVPHIPLSATERVGDLKLATQREAIQSRTARWTILQTIYGSSGKVQVEAVLSLQELLRPYAVARARVGSPPVRGPLDPTGVVVDARGHALRPSYAPKILTEGGDVLYDGALWEEPAVTVPPFRYVADAAHPLAAVAGDHPVFVVATGTRGGNLVVADAEAAAIRQAVGHTTVVVVVGE